MKYIVFIAIIISSALSSKAQSTLKNQTNMYQQDSSAIAATLNNYFKGIYEGDTTLLGSVFYRGSLLFGDVKGQPYYKTLPEYLTGVKNRQSPKDSGKPFKGAIISIEIINSIAIAKVSVQMYEFNYSELLSFHKIDDKWVIVNKMISDIN
jgi:hypothetical protein